MTTSVRHSVMFSPCGWLLAAAIRLPLTPLRLLAARWPSHVLHTGIRPTGAAHCSSPQSPSRGSRCSFYGCSRSALESEGGRSADSERYVRSRWLSTSTSTAATTSRGPRDEHATFLLLVAPVPNVCHFSRPGGRLRQASIDCLSRDHDCTRAPKAIKHAVQYYTAGATLAHVLDGLSTVRASASNCWSEWGRLARRRRLAALEFHRHWK